MDVKQWLGRGYRIDGEIENLIREKEALFGRMTSVSSPEYGDKVKTTPKNRTEELLASYLAYEERINRRIDDLIQVKQEILCVVSLVTDPVLRQLLERRYIQFQTWETIAEGLGYSDRWVRKTLHPKALNECGKFIEKIEKKGGEIPPRPKNWRKKLLFQMQAFFQRFLKQR